MAVAAVGTLSLTLTDKITAPLDGFVRTHAKTMAQELTLAALQMAITNRQPDPGLLQHTDRGSQYAAHDYRHLLAKHGTLCSMSRKGNCWDNAPMESFFGSLETEIEEDGPFLTR